MKSLSLAFFFVLYSGLLLAQTNDEKIPDGFTSLFNGNDFTNWKVPVGDNGHWKILNGVIDYDAESEAKKRIRAFGQPNRIKISFSMWIGVSKQLPGKIKACLSYCLVACINLTKMVKR